MQYRICTQYKDDSALRGSFNRLARRTFGIDFESWYQAGCWTGHYIPYSFECGGEIVANVSVNLMDFLLDGVQVRLIQLGTVMTDPAHRGRGLASQLINQALSEHLPGSAGAYLFANSAAAGFYPQFGFSSQPDRRYQKAVAYNSKPTVKQVLMSDSKQRRAFEQAVRSAAPCGRFDMRNNPELILFYTSGELSRQIYYIESQNAYAVAELSGETLELKAVFSPVPFAVDEVIGAFGNRAAQVRLGFTPCDCEGFSAMPEPEIHGSLFVLGDWFRDFLARGLMFPILSRA